MSLEDKSNSSKIIEKNNSSKQEEIKQDLYNSIETKTESMFILEWKDIEKYSDYLDQINTLLLFLVFDFVKKYSWTNKYQKIVHTYWNFLFTYKKQIKAEELKKLLDDIDWFFNFINKNNIWVFPMYLNINKSPTCSWFVFRVLDQFSNFSLKNNALYLEKNFEEKLYQHIENLEKQWVIYEIERWDSINIGDIVVYLWEKENEYKHIWFIYSKELSVISKFGFWPIYETPLVNHYFKKTWAKIFKINDPHYYINFIRKFTAIIEKMRMNEERLRYLLSKARKYSDSEILEKLESKILEKI